MFRDYYDDPDLITTVLDGADLERQANSRSKCVKGVRTRFMYGEFGSGAARQELSDLGLGLDVAADLVQGWACERSSKRKAPVAGRIIGWFKRALIPAADARARLVQLGYQDDSIDLMLAQAILEVNEAAAKKLKADMKEADRLRRQAIADAKAAMPCREVKPKC